MFTNGTSGSKIDPTADSAERGLDPDGERNVTSWHIQIQTCQSRAEVPCGNEAPSTRLPPDGKPMRSVPTSTAPPASTCFLAKARLHCNARTVRRTVRFRINSAVRESGSQLGVP